MGTKTIDIIQSNKIAALEADVLELRTALNLLVTDVLAMSVKLNILIVDQNNMNGVIMAGYTTPGSPESYGILEGIDKHKDNLTEHISRNTPHPVFWPYSDPARPEYWDREADMTGGNYDYPWYSYTGSNSSFAKPKFYNQWLEHKLEWKPEASGGAGSRVSGDIPGNSWSAGDPVVGGTGQVGNTTASTDEVNAAVVGLYTGLGESILSIKKSSADRARKLARQTLNRLRK